MVDAARNRHACLLGPLTVTYVVGALLNRDHRGKLPRGCGANRLYVEHDASARQTRGRARLTRVSGVASRSIHSTLRPSVRLLGCAHDAEPPLRICRIRLTTSAWPELVRSRSRGQRRLSAGLGASRGSAIHAAESKAVGKPDSRASSSTTKTSCAIPCDRNCDVFRQAKHPSRR